MRSRDGGFVVKFALALPVLLGLTGSAIDYVSILHLKGRLQAAADAASRAAAQEFTLIDISKNDVTALASAIVNRTMNTNSGPSSDGQSIQVTAKAATEPQLRVTVDVYQSVKGTFGKFGLIVPGISVRSVAQVIGKPNICVLGLDNQAAGTIELLSKARMTGQNCAVYSNSTSADGIMSKANSVISATMICSVGGSDGGKGNFSPEPYTDCPVFEDPLASRAPPVIGSCTATRRLLLNETVTLQPGVYCGGITIKGRSVVTFAPGEFILKDGPLSVDDRSSITGEFVGFFLTGTNARIIFTRDTTITLSAPKSGSMAGLLFYESRAQTTSLLHEINSDNARMLLGTIYLPRGELVIDANKPVADQSAYTAIVARMLKLHSGPNLVLNTNYDQTAIPVPEGIKGVGQPVALVQ